MKPKSHYPELTRISRRDKTRSKFQTRERSLIGSNEVCRISTLSPSGWPHLVTVGYVYLNGTFYIPASRRAKKVRNLRNNPKATTLIDDEHNESGIMLECYGTILEDHKAEKLKEFMRTRKGWKNDETSVILPLRPVRKATWLLR